MKAWQGLVLFAEGVSSNGRYPLNIPSPPFDSGPKSDESGCMQGESQPAATFICKVVETGAVEGMARLSPVRGGRVVQRPVPSQEREIFIDNLLVRIII